MNKRTSILINVLLIAALLVTGFLMAGAYDQACGVNDNFSDVTFQQITGYTTSTQSYSGSDVTAIHIVYGTEENISIHVNVDMINYSSITSVYNVDSAAITIDSGSASALSSSGIAMSGSVSYSSTSVDPTVFTRTLTVSDTTPTGLYAVPLTFTIHNEYSEGGYTNNYDFTINETIYILVKEQPTAPAAPTAASRTSNSITLTELTGGEYSMDGTNWQDSNVFTGLDPTTEYTFYQRLKETSTAYISPVSVAAQISTKAVQAAPDAPTVASETGSSVTLTELAGGEYSMDGTNWQDSTVFTGLNPVTEYTFYQRLKETDTAYVSPASTGTSATTDRATQAAPAAPTVASKTDTSVTLTAMTGMEYSLDGTNWQDSNIFTGLSAKTSYTFYQRLMETATAYASPASSGTAVTTNAALDSSVDTGDSGAITVLLLVCASAVALVTGLVIRKKLKK